MTAVHDAIGTKFEALVTAALAPLYVKPENIAYTPSQGEAYAKFTYLPARTARVALSSALFRQQGLVQVDLFLPAGEGAGAAGLLAAKLEDAFQPGNTFTADGVEVTLDEVSRGPALDEPGWYRLPLSIYWHSFNTNA